MTKQSQAQIENQESIRASGKKLALLLGSSDLPGDIQHSIISLLPQMSLDQIDRLTQVLEIKLADAATQHLDKRLEEDLRSLIG